MTAGDGVRDEAAEIEHHARGKNEQALLEHCARAQTLESAPEHERAGRTHTAVHSTFVLMEIEQLPLAGALMLTPRIFTDERGFFKETYSLDRYRGCGIKETFVQDNLSLSHRDVLRGLHGDPRMAKLVGVIARQRLRRDRRPPRTRARPIAAGARERSPLPRGNKSTFRAAFCTASWPWKTRRIFAYKQSAPYDPAAEFSVAWDDRGHRDRVAARRPRADPFAPRRREPDACIARRCNKRGPAEVGAARGTESRGDGIP